MRRGLMAWDANEVPLEALQGRIERVQAAMAAAGQDALLLYTNFIRSGAVAWLTGFSPYWADGVLMVPKRGEPVFATTLSNRVATWVQSVKPIGELVHSPAPGAAIGERIKADRSARRIAVLELDAFPGGLYEELAAALPDVEIVDGSASFAAARREVDSVEAALLVHADELAAGALGSVDPQKMTQAGAIVGAVESHARLRGAEEAYIAIAPDLDADPRFRRLSGDHGVGRRFAVRATIAYKGCWIRRTRTYARTQGDRSAFDAIERWFETCAATLDPRRPLGPQLSESLGLLTDAKLHDWTAEAAVGTRPLAPIGSAKSADDAREAPWAVLTLRLSLGGLPWLGARLIGTHARKAELHAKKSSNSPIRP